MVRLTMRLTRFAENPCYNSYRRSLRQQMRRTVAAYEQFSNFREPLREGAPKAIIPKRLSSTTFLSTTFFCEQRKDATRGSPQGDHPSVLP